MKRALELMQLSRDHHSGLLLCWKIRYGLNHKISIDRIVAYLKHSFTNELEPHFKLEEEFAFILLPETHPMRLEALAQHALLRKQVGQMGEDPVNEEMLKTFSDLLELHIRFEERQLFPLIESSTPPEALKASGELINGEWEKGNSIWDDEFWIIKN